MDKVKRFKVVKEAIQNRYKGSDRFIGGICDRLGRNDLETVLALFKVEPFTKEELEEAEKEVNLRDSKTRCKVCRRRLYYCSCK